MNSSRIAFFLPALPAGGLEQVTLALARGLVARGYRVDLLLEERTGAYLERVPPDIEVIALDRRSRWSGYRRFLTGWPREGFTHLGGTIGVRPRSIPLHRLDSLVSYIEQRRPDVMIAALERVPLLALWARRIARHRMGLIIAEHSTFSRRLAGCEHDERAYATMAHRRDLMRRLYPSADAVVAVSNGVADDLANAIDLDRAAITTIYNPVVSPALQARAAEPVDHPWFTPSAPPVIITAGRLVAEKAFHVLIDAFATLRTQDHNVRLMILGEGPLRKALETQVDTLGLSDHIALPGWIENPHAWMARSAVFALSSVVEGLPTTLIEAMACGCPVAATDCPSGPREILDNGRLGPLVPVGDAPALAQVMADLLAQPTPRTNLLARAEHFSVERALDAYQDLIENAHPPSIAAL